jgi:type II secretory pathway predicted ATPase ExeA
MTDRYKVYFGFSKEPFSNEIRAEDMLETQGLTGVKERFMYTIRLGAIALVTGDIGSGKSCALRFASKSLHPSEYRIIYITATSGSIIELYKQICYELDVNIKGSSKAFLTRIIRTTVNDIRQTKQKPVLIIDEASILRLEVFSELHTIVQFEADSKSFLPIILAGQNNLIDNLMFRNSKPLASRVVARAQMETLKIDEMVLYLTHHLNIAGCKQNLFSEQAVTAIHQGSGGLLRRANNLARGSLVAAALDSSDLVSPEHVRIASTEII